MLGDNLGKWTATYADASLIPRELYPVFQPAPERLPLPVEAPLERVISGSGLLTQNYTVWTVESDDPLGMLRACAADAERQGWDVADDELTDASHFYWFRATRGSEMMEAFEMRDAYGPHTEYERVYLVFRYSNRMDSEAFEPVWAAIAERDDLPVEVELGFYHFMAAAQKEQLVADWRERGGLPLAAERYVIRTLKEEGAADEIGRRLRACYLSVLFGDKESKKKLIQFAREILDDEQWELSPPSLDELVDMGAQVCADNAVAEVALNQPALFLLEKEDRKIVAAITVTPSEIPEGLYTLSAGELSGPDFSHGGLSMSSTLHSHEHPWSSFISSGCNAICYSADAEEIGTNRFRIALSVSQN